MLRNYFFNKIGSFANKSILNYILTIIGGMILCTLFLFVLLMGQLFWTTNHIKTAQNTVYTDLIISREIKSTFSSIRYLEAEYLVTQDLDTLKNIQNEAKKMGSLLLQFSVIPDKDKAQVLQQISIYRQLLSKATKTNKKYIENSRQLALSIENTLNFWELNAIQDIRNISTVLVSTNNRILWEGLILVFLLIVYGFYYSSRYSSMMVSSIQDMVLSLQKLSRGDLNIEHHPNLENELGHLENALSELSQIVQLMVSDTKQLSTVCRQGNLDERLNIDRLEGSYKTIISNINDTLNSLTHPIQRLLEIQSKMAQGDLKQNFDGQYEGIFKRIQRVTNENISTLNTMLSNIATVAKLLNTESRKLSDSALQLKTNLSTTSKAIGLIKSLIYNVKSESDKNTHRALTVTTLTSEMVSEANKGTVELDSMYQSVENMVEESSKIVKINQLISDIASQTNLLSLNANVKAQKAGIYGKEFSVVANEIRELSIKIHQASKGVSEMIQQALSGIDLGAKAAKESRKFLGNIETNLSKIKTHMSEVNYSTLEQNKTLLEINEQVNALATTAQSNSETYNDQSLLSQQLAKVSDDLIVQVKKFNI